VSAPAVDVVVRANAARVLGPGRQGAECHRRVDALRRREYPEGSDAELAVVAIAPAPRLPVRIERAGMHRAGRYAVKLHPATDRHHPVAGGRRPVTQLPRSVETDALDIERNGLLDAGVVVF